MQRKLLVLSELFNNVGNNFAEKNNIGSLKLDDQSN